MSSAFGRVGAPTQCLFEIVAVWGEATVYVKRGGQDLEVFAGWRLGVVCGVCQ